MEEGAQQLVEMVTYRASFAPRLAYDLLTQGATVAQARAALKQHKDVMLAAERFLEGKFDHIQDEDGDVQMEEAKASIKKKVRPPVRLCITSHCASPNPKKPRRPMKMMTRWDQATMRTTVSALPASDDAQYAKIRIRRCR